MLTSKDNYNINFTGLTHDHSQSAGHNCPSNSISGCPQTRATKIGPDDDDDDRAIHPQDPQDSQYCSVIGILRRHPMYDCLLLVKKYRNCLGGYSLEFPIDKMRPEELEAAADIQQVENETENENENTNSNNRRPECNQRRLVSRYLDGDDPMHQVLGVESSPAATTTCPTTASGELLVEPFLEQLDDKGEHCELVHVPINGLLDRLDGYTRNQVAVDSRVYSFAMGLKTAERIMTTKSMKELQETPI